MGHQKGAERIDEIVKYACEMGIRILTIFAFSTENWKREQKEISFLFQLFSDYARNKIDDINSRGIRVRILGNLNRIPPALNDELFNIMTLSEKNEKMIVNIAINYGGRDELVRTFNKILLLKPSENSITEELISNNLDTIGLPDPDLIIRTSGEQRLSNFLLWQSAYSELYFTKIYWPDFDKNQFDIALKEFQNRKRRLGK